MDDIKLKDLKPEVQIEKIREIMNSHAEDIRVLDERVRSQNKRIKQLEEKTQKPDVCNLD